jgi:DNA-binding NarL/FixJ family response regulator
MIVVLFSEMAAQAHPMPAPGSMAATARLTRAEVEVLAGLLKGLPAKAIASRRSASVNTVRTQIVSILEKTGYNSQKELMASFSHSVLPDSVFTNSIYESHSTHGEPTGREGLRS